MKTEPISEYQINETSEEIRITHLPSKYHMIIEKSINSSKDKLGHEIRFIGPQLKELEDNGFGIPITSRDLDGYTSQYKKLKINPNHQYLEIGAGLGGFMHNLTTNYSLKKTPIIVDPLNPKTINSLIDLALSQNFPEKTNSRLGILKQRCELFLNGQVNHIQERLEDIPSMHPKLKNSIDQIIENIGPTFHYMNGMARPEIERKLKRLEYTKNFLQKK